MCDKLEIRRLWATSAALLRDHTQFRVLYAVHPMLVTSGKKHKSLTLLGIKELIISSINSITLPENPNIKRLYVRRNDAFRAYQQIMYNKQLDFPV